MAAKNQAEVDAYEAKLTAIRDEADAKGKTWEIEISQDRLIKQTRTQDYVVIAQTKEEAEEFAKTAPEVNIPEHIKAVPGLTFFQKS